MFNFTQFLLTNRQEAYAHRRQSGSPCTHTEHPQTTAPQSNAHGTCCATAKPACRRAAGGAGANGERTTRRPLHSGCMAGAAHPLISPASPHCWQRLRAALAHAEAAAKPNPTPAGCMAAAAPLPQPLRLPAQLLPVLARMGRASTPYKTLSRLQGSCGAPAAAAAPACTQLAAPGRC